MVQLEKSLEKVKVGSVALRKRTNGKVIGCQVEHSKWRVFFSQQTGCPRGTKFKRKNQEATGVGG